MEAQLRLCACSALIVLVIVACGGGDDDTAGTGTPTVTTTPQAGSTTSAAGDPIGPDGGFVTSQDGSFSVEIPAGALQETVDISVGTVDPASLGIEASALAGPVYDLQPSGLGFSQPVTLVRRMPADDFDVDDLGIPLAVVLQRHGDALTFLSSTTSLEGDDIVVRAETSQFSENLAAISMAPAAGGTVRLSPPSLTQEVDASQPVFLDWDDWVDDSDLVITTDWLGEGSIEMASGRHTAAEATCASVGDGAYVASIFGRGEISDATKSWFVWAPAFRVDEDDDFTATVAGLATCTEKPSLAPDEIIDVYEATADYAPVEGGPPGAEFTAELVFRITEQDGELVVEIEQLPQGQLQEGWAKLSEVVSFGVVGSEAGYTEGTVGWLIPDGDVLAIRAFNWGSGPGQEALFQQIIDEFFLSAEPSDIYALPPDGWPPALGGIGVQVTGPYTVNWAFTVDGEAAPEQ